MEASERLRFQARDPADRCGISGRQNLAYAAAVPPRPKAKGDRICLSSAYTGAYAGLASSLPSGEATYEALLETFHRLFFDCRAVVLSHGCALVGPEGRRLHRFETFGFVWRHHDDCAGATTTGAIAAGANPDVCEWASAAQ